MGVVGLEDFPYYRYGRYPSGARPVSVYNSSLPGRWNGDYNPYYESSIYDNNSAPFFAVDVPFTRDADFVRKRKLDGLKGEEISAGGHDGHDLSVGNGLKSNIASESSAQPLSTPAVSSTPATRQPEPRQDSATGLTHSFASSSGEDSSRPRVISIPVMSSDDGQDKTVKCTVRPEAGTKKSRMAMTAEGPAVLIQSWFRGFQVRRTGPLTQLRQIATVKSQLVELDSKVSDADFINYVQENSTARVKLMEEIMKLLLQLDAIQGVHPFVRDVRKLATRAVIGLQERVDALLFTEVAVVEPSSILMEIEEGSDDLAWNGDVRREIPRAAEMPLSDTVTAAFVTVDDKELPRGSDVNPRADTFREAENGAGNEKEDLGFSTVVTQPGSAQDNGEVGPSEGGHEGMHLETSGADADETSKTYDNLSTSMVEPDPDHGNGDIGTVQSSVELMDVEVVKMERLDLEGAQLREADAHHGGAALDEDAGSALVGTLSEAAEVTIAEAVDIGRLNSSDERAVQSGIASEDAPQDSWQINEDLGRERIDDESNDDARRMTSDLSESDDADTVNTKNAKDSSLACSPRSPFEALDYLDFPASVSDSELQSELQNSPAQGSDYRAMLLKLSEENKALKSLLVTVMKWNQMQASAMQDVNHRLATLESRMSPRNGKKKLNSRRKLGKSGRMML